MDARRVAAALLLAGCPDLGDAPPPDAPPDGIAPDVPAEDLLDGGAPDHDAGAPDRDAIDGPDAGADAATCPDEPVSVTIAYMSFMPAAVVVPRGCPVVWTNLDGTSLHTVTSGTPEAPDGLFDSGELMNGQSFTFTFTEAGTYVYFCTTHPDTMRDATVTVQ